MHQEPPAPLPCQPAMIAPRPPRHTRVHSAPVPVTPVVQESPQALSRRLVSTWISGPLEVYHEHQRYQEYLQTLKRSGNMRSLLPGKSVKALSNRGFIAKELEYLQLEIMTASPGLSKEDALQRAVIALNQAYSRAGHSGWSCNQMYRFCKAQQEDRLIEQTGRMMGLNITPSAV
ncbi:MAG: hypothetical protein BYD32DRAFT_408118 [Podila humilis]|nr:MAG: hypothetical protein BYD32DRAFT_408118 [Podila humilis]